MKRPSALSPAPVPPRRPATLDYHGKPYPDEFHGLREKTDRGVLAWLKAENRYARGGMADTVALRGRLFREMAARLVPEDVSVPAKEGGFHYLHRIVAGREYPVYARRRGTPDGPETTLLDVNALAEGNDFMKLGVLSVSPDGRRLAYSVDTTGDEEHELRFRDLETGADLPDRIVKTAYGSAWSACGRYFFYTVVDAMARSFACRRHRLGDDPAADVTVFEEPDVALFVHVGKTEDGRYILIHARSQVTAEIRFLPAAEPLAAPRVLLARRHGVEYSAAHRDGKFYLLTNDGAVNFRVLAVPAADPGARAEVVVPHDPAVAIEHLRLFAGHLALFTREGGLPAIRIRDLATGRDHAIRFDEPAYTLSMGENREFDTPLLRYVYESMKTPPTVVDYDMARGVKRVLKVEPVPGYDPGDYVTERVFATAPDGVRVPLSLLYRAGLRRNGRNPVYLHGYGAYGVIEEAEFHPERLSLVDRGFVYAIAHPRGGGELGRGWYEAGKKLKKRNTFLDFAACAEWLVREKFTSARRIAAFGRSAGGLLAGCALTMFPDLWGAVVAEVPFVDILHTMMDPTLTLTVREYDEWGNPNEPAAFDCIRSYSPYDNVTARAYPPALFLGGLNDPRVGFWEPAKMVARLRERKTDRRPLYLVTKMGEGHKHDGARYAPFKGFAFKYAFVLKALKRV